MCYVPIKRLKEMYSYHTPYNVMFFDLFCVLYQKPTMGIISAYKFTHTTNEKKDNMKKQFASQRTT